MSVIQRMSGSGEQPGRAIGVALDIVLATLGTWILAAHIPWQEVLRSTIPTGGDNPSHPVLMQSLGEAFFSHGTVAHYSYRFWCGFEAFQFYFPLPYLCGAALARLIDPDVAFKLTTLAGLLGLPIAFYYMAKWFGLSKITSVLASLLSLSFLFTDAHTMWGANVKSTLAGMIANSWAFVFLVLAIGKLVQAFSERHFLVAGVVFTTLAMLSHFYAILTLFVLYLSFALRDAFRAGALVRDLPRSAAVYTMGFVSMLLVAWWLVPLVAYQPYSSEFGGNWDVVLLDTFRTPEKVFFVIAPLVIAGYLLVLRRAAAPATSSGEDDEESVPRQAAIKNPCTIGLLFLGVNIVLFYWGDRLPSVAFINIRVWPQLYLACYITIILAIEIVRRTLPLPAFAMAVGSLYFLLPSSESTDAARQWMTWNYSGIEAKTGYPEFREVVERLRQAPAGRVSFESSDRNNYLLGSVRAFELLPYLTEHEVVEGGIVNSATYPGIPYFLQCLSSSTCAGWPAGSIMPEQDIPRAIDMMRALGVGYHIAASAEARAALDASPELTKLFSGRFFALYALTPPPALVEVYDGPPLLVADPRPQTTLVNLPRWDVMRNAAVAFDTSEIDTASTTPETMGQRAAASQRLFDFLVHEWHTERRVADRGWANRRTDALHYLNAYVLSRHPRANLPDDVKMDMAADPEFFIADRNWDPDVMSPEQGTPYPALALPLTSQDDMEASLTIHGRGYRVFADEREVPLNVNTTVPLDRTDRPAILAFVESSDEPYPFVDTVTDGDDLRPGFSGQIGLELPARITDRCKVALTSTFHRLVLRTTCRGKPHLVKYHYYPKWHADSDLRLATNGFILLVPENEVTTFEHRGGFPDIMGKGLSLGGLALLLLLAGVRRWT